LKADYVIVLGIADDGEVLVMMMIMMMLKRFPRILESYGNSWIFPETFQDVESPGK